MATIDLTGGISRALSDTFNRFNQDDLSRKAEAEKQEQLKYTRDRNTALDLQNKQLFDAKMADIARADTDRANEAAYLQGITQPGAYGLKAGTENIVNQLSQYTGDNPRAKAALAAGPGTKEYEAYFADMTKLGDTITGQSMDDRTIGFATANPENTYAAREALKASIARQNALDTELKTANANKLKYDLKGMEYGADGTNITSKSSNSGSVLADMYKGSKVIGYRPLTGEGKMTGTDKATIVEVAKTLDLNPNAVEDLVAGAKSDDSTFGGLFGTNMKLNKAKLLTEATKLKSNEVAKYGNPGSVSNSTQYKDTLNGLSNTYANRISELEKQRSGNYGMDELAEITRIKEEKKGITPETVATITPTEAKENPADTIATIAKDEGTKFTTANVDKLAKLYTSLGGEGKSAGLIDDIKIKREAEAIAEKEGVSVDKVMDVMKTKAKQDLKIAGRNAIIASRQPDGKFEGKTEDEWLSQASDRQRIGQKYGWMAPIAAAVGPLIGLSGAYGVSSATGASIGATNN